MAILGNWVHIQTYVKDYKKAWEYYKQFDFQKVHQSIFGNYWFVDLTDGNIHLILSDNPLNTTGLCYFSTDIIPILKKIESLKININQKYEDNGKLASFWFNDPNGVVIQIVDWDVTEYHKNQGVAVTKFGKFQELSIETTKFEETKAFWEQLGFGEDYPFLDKKPRWGGMTDGLINIGLYELGACPHVFGTPAITYFEAKDMPERIQRLKNEGITFIQEMKEGDFESAHAILKTPDNQLFFLFMC